MHSLSLSNNRILISHIFMRGFFIDESNALFSSVVSRVHRVSTQHETVFLKKSICLFISAKPATQFIQTAEAVFRTHHFTVSSQLGIKQRNCVITAFECIFEFLFHQIVEIAHSAFRADYGAIRSDSAFFVFDSIKIQHSGLFLIFHGCPISTHHKTDRENKTGRKDEKCSVCDIFHIHIDSLLDLQL